MLCPSVYFIVQYLQYFRSYIIVYNKEINLPHFRKVCSDTASIVKQISEQNCFIKRTTLNLLWCKEQTVPVYLTLHDSPPPPPLDQDTSLCLVMFLTTSYSHFTALLIPQLVQRICGYTLMSPGSQSLSH